MRTYTITTKVYYHLFGLGERFRNDYVSIKYTPKADIVCGSLFTKIRILYMNFKSDN